MLVNTRLIMPFVVLLLSLLQIPAQTRDEFRQKYEATENGGYIVRPGIVMTVSYAKESQVQEFRIQQQTFLKTGNSDSDSETMSLEAASEIVDEIIPVSQRGKLIREITFSAGCTSIQTSRYELVSISHILKCSSSGIKRVLFTAIYKKL